MKVRIDNREKKRIKKAKKYYKEQEHEVTVEKLETGDYLFDDKVVFEFKTYSDMFASIMDNRVFDESLRQKEKYDYHYVIIVGNDKDRQDALYKLFKLKVRFKIKQYYGAVARLNTYTNVIYAPNTSKAFKIMECQAEKCLDNKPLVRNLNKKTDNIALNILMFMPDIKYQRAKSICDTLDLKTVEDLMNLKREDLLSVNRVGDKIADNILSNLKNNYDMS